MQSGSSCQSWRWNGRISRACQGLREDQGTLLSFRELVKDAEPTEIVSLISSIVERVYVTRDGKNEVCHIYIRGLRHRRLFE